MFRGETSGERIGPFVSQFLWRDVCYGVKTVEQRFRAPSRRQSFLNSFDSWVACQRGSRTGETLRLDPTRRDISSYRELVEYVHRDFSFQPFMNAALIALHIGGDRRDAVLSPTNPYRGSVTQFGDITLGSKNVLSLLAQKTSYYYKWRAHRRARPEAIGARLDLPLSGRKSYDLHPAILEATGSRVPKRVSVPGCCLRPIPRVARRIRRIRPLAPSTPERARSCSRRSLTKDISFQIRSKPRSTVRDLRRGEART